MAPDGSAIVRLTTGTQPDWQPVPQRPPGPATGKEACKNGGWEALGFRNQGQCVKAASEAAP